MHRENRRRVRMLFQSSFQCPVHVPHGFSQILTPVGGHEDQPFPAGQRLHNDWIVEHKILLHRGIQRVNDRVAGHKDAAGRHIFL